MNIPMTVETSPCKKSIFVRGSWPRKLEKVRIGVDRMASDIVAALAKEGHLPYQKLQVVTSVNLVADEAVLWNRGMFKGKGSSLFSMTFITEIVYGIGLDHALDIRCPHGVVAARAPDLPLSNRMMRLLIRLGSDVSMAIKTKVGLSELQKILSRYR
jgi:hypothetical protein